MAKVLLSVNQLGTLLSVVIIDVVLAGDNAIVVGMAAAGLPVQRRRNVIVLGIAAATVLRILFAYFAVQLLAIIGLTLAGGVLLLWVSWKMYREIRETSFYDPSPTEEVECRASRTRPSRTTRTRITRISTSSNNYTSLFTGPSHTPELTQPPRSNTLQIYWLSGQTMASS